MKNYENLELILNKPLKDEKHQTRVEIIHEKIIHEKHKSKTRVLCFSSLSGLFKKREKLLILAQPASQPSAHRPVVLIVTLINVLVVETAGLKTAVRYGDCGRVGGGL